MKYGGWIESMNPKEEQRCLGVKDRGKEYQLRAHLGDREQHAAAAGDLGKQISRLEEHGAEKCPRRPAVCRRADLVPHEDLGRGVADRAVSWCGLVGAISEMGEGPVDQQQALFGGVHQDVLELQDRGVGNRCNDLDQIRCSRLGRLGFVAGLLIAARRPGLARIARHWKHYKFTSTYAR